MTKQEILQHTKAFLFDLDGTLYLGEKLIGNASQTLGLLRGMDKKVVFLTNNSSKTEEEYREKLTKLGLFEAGDMIYSSAKATVFYLNRHFPKSKVYLVATEAIKEEFQRAGIVLDEEKPDVAVLSYDVELTFEKIKKFDYFLKHGVVFLATHADDVCPSEDSSIPDVGSFLAMFERSSGRTPDRIIGKPNTDMAKGVAAATGFRESELCMVGDRMYTDIRFANNNGLKSILVLSGETNLLNMNNFPDTPDLILSSVNELVKSV